MRPLDDNMLQISSQ